MILGDFHIHSNFSDGKHSIPEIVDHYGKRGFGAIAITDHVCDTQGILGKAAGYLERTLTEATFPIYLEILKSEQARAWELYRMRVIPGIEITKNSFSNHRSAHFLALGIQKWVSANLSIVEALEACLNQGALTIAAHPVSTRKFEKQTFHLWDRRQELKSLFDAWEVASGKVMFQEVADSDLPLIANSDLHHFGQLESWKTVLHCDSQIHSIFEAIRKQRLHFQYYHPTQEDDHGVPFPRHLDWISQSYGNRNLDRISAARFPPHRTSA